MPNNEPDYSEKAKKVGFFRFRALTKEEKARNYANTLAGKQKRTSLRGRQISPIEAYEAANAGAHLGFWPGLALMALAYTNAVPEVTTAVSVAQRVVKSVFNVNW